MKLWLTAITGLALAGALASPAAAQGGAEGTNFSDNTVLMVTTGGQVMRKQVTDPAMVSMMTKDAKQMTSGTMMMMHGGKMWMIQDKKMPDGTMMSDKVKAMR